ncbi:hypothetical protein LCGC14_1385520 [marine sediment metagenome]|uniref:HAD family phosphatase n=1 Tax=marine sediment metagenome TaxID=412755 RepID=A0A0F9KMD3_9ZZZZ
MADRRVIQAAVFDLGGVVVDICVEATARYWAEAMQADLAEVLDPFMDDTRYQLMERGEMTMADYHAHMVRRLGGDLSFQDFVAGWNSLLRDPLPGVEGLLAELAAAVRLVALTNTNATHAARWRHTCQAELAHFERVFVSYEIGARKPEPACYRHVLDYLALPPERVAFIDDSPENVAAAEALGMRGIVAEGTDQIARRLAELGVPLNGDGGHSKCSG